MLGWQHGLVKMRREGLARDTIILVEHPEVITVGRAGHDENFADIKLEPIFVERGGDVTYHGPGQLVAYFIFNLARRGRDLHRFMKDVQQGIIDALDILEITAKRGKEHTGVWVEEKKIASIGIAVKNWISFHGAAINLCTDMSDFERIQPCGLNPGVMTSASVLLQRNVTLEEFAPKLMTSFEKVFDTCFESVSLEDLADEMESQVGGYTI